ncbi:septation protein SepH [Kineococcus sp. SYSU DK006]|uniref:septation protein SepH n=1 Tax=Kineococcus sp. SYSU DK006 TaxID=3383127 RepID=UPI003D7EF189
MQDLRLVGVHDDGEHVVLVAPDGNRYRLRVDEALRAAVRRDRARLGQLQIQMEAQLRPRDIQARIRSGESAEDVAAAGGLTLEHVRRYEGPVLAERAHVAGLARRTPFGRGAAGTLDEVVVARLTARAVDPEGARWDSWREEDGGWTVQCEFVAGGRGRVARWGFDPAARVLSARDDEARWLSEEEPAEAGPLPSRRLVSLVGEGRPASERVYDVEADGGVRTSERGRRQDGTAERRPARPSTGDILDALDAQRGVRPSPPHPDVEADGGADGGGSEDAQRADRHDEEPPGEQLDASAAAPRVDALLADPPPAHPAASAPHELQDRTVLPAPPAATTTAGSRSEDEVGEAAGTAASPGADQHADQSADRHADQGAQRDAEQAPAEDVEQAPARVPAQDAAAEQDAGVEEPREGTAEAPVRTQPEPRPPARRRNRSQRRGGAGGGGGGAGKRSSVPSWDEIMFGTKKD